MGSVALPPTMYQPGHVPQTPQSVDARLPIPAPAWPAEIVGGCIPVVDETHSTLTYVANRDPAALAAKLAWIHELLRDGKAEVFAESTGTIDDGDGQPLAYAWIIHSGVSVECD